MKRNVKSTEEILRQSLGQFKQISPEEMESAGSQALRHLGLQNRENLLTQNPRSKLTRTARRSRWIAAAAIAAVVVVAVLVSTRIVQSAPATLEDENGTRRIHYGEIVRSSDDMNAMLSMTGGARVEVRSMSELSLERVEDGVRIRLNRGGVIVDAAAQHSGNLYVGTPDMVASVVGTVSLVKAEEAGSRVAAIGGEVRVRQGTREQTLRTGEQMASSPSMLIFPVEQEIHWSRNSEAHLARLQQSSIGRLEESDVFEVISVRTNHGRGKVEGGQRGQAPANSGGGPCSGGRIQLDPGRFAVADAGIYTLIMLAYAPLNSVWSTNTMTAAGDCKRHWAPDGMSGPGRLSGGPEWIQSTTFDIEARVPEGPPSFLNFTRDAQQISPRLQRMIQNMLKERFHLVLRRDTKEMPGYVLSVGPGGPKLTLWKENEEDPLVPGTFIRPHAATGTGTFAGRRNFLSSHKYADELMVGHISGGKQSMPDLARLLERVEKKPVVDRTSLTGAFNFEVFFAPAEFWNIPDKSFVLTKPSLADVLQEELGLQLEAARVPLEVLVIERLEKPSEN